MMTPLHSPRPILTNPGRSQYPRKVTSSPSSRKVRVSPVGKEGLTAILCELKQAPASFIPGPGDGAAAEHITRLKIAAIACVMGQQLGRRPVEIAQVAAAEATGSRRLALLGERR